MSSSHENHDNPGIFVRVMGSGKYEVRWLDGHALIEMANEEENETGEPITDHLEARHVESYARPIYSPWGEYEGVTVLRRLTLHEAVHYLGRDSKVCAFLRPKMQAVRFIQGLERGKDPTEHKVAAEVRHFLNRFDEIGTAKMSKTAMYRMMEEQLLNITTK